jgi:hypothetical protein
MTPLSLCPADPAAPISLIAEAEAREAIAHSVERGATIGFFLVLAVFVLIVLRHRRQKWLAT